MNLMLFMLITLVLAFIASGVILFLSLRIYHKTNSRILGFLFLLLAIVSSSYGIAQLAKAIL